MKTTAYTLVVLATLLRATTYAFVLPSCGASNCLPNGLFYNCTPSNLTCLCAQEQPLVDTYVVTIEPCLASEERKEFCTDGALYQYKDLLTRVCAGEGKTVTW